MSHYDDIAALWANSATFQSWTGAGSVLAALGFVHNRTALPSATRPLVIVEPIGDTLSAEQHGVNVHTLAGETLCRVVGEFDSAKITPDGEVSVSDTADEFETFEENVAAIMLEIRALGKAAGYKNVRGLALAGDQEFGARADAAKRIGQSLPVDIWQDVAISWGFNAGA